MIWPIPAMHAGFGSEMVAGLPSSLWPGMLFCLHRGFRRDCILKYPGWLLSLLFYLPVPLLSSGPSVSCSYQCVFVMPSI